jgi:TolB-like protein
MALAFACDGVSKEAVRMELNRVLKSRVFSQSTRLCKFLDFTIEHTIAGKADLLKEYLIGTKVYARRLPFDPTQDSIVRTEARRLRAKLKQYYENEGKNDPIQIHFDVGRYVPSFVQRPSIKDMASLASGDGSGLVCESTKVLMGAEPIRDLAQTALSVAFGDGLAEEIAHVLMRRGLRSVISGSFGENRNSPASAEPIPQYPDFRLEGSIQEGEGGLSVMVKLVKADRFQMV